eukprot:2239975-Alexandrium_andersonii.AAC.1
MCTGQRVPAPTAASTLNGALGSASSPAIERKPAARGMPVRVALSESVASMVATERGQTGVR